MNYADGAGVWHSRLLLRSLHVALRRSETMKIDRIYKINKMRRKKINPVNLVNPVYFLRSENISKGHLRSGGIGHYSKTGRINVRS